jgi:hypothetical protein
MMSSAPVAEMVVPMDAVVPGAIDVHASAGEVPDAKTAWVSGKDASMNPKLEASATGTPSIMPHQQQRKVYISLNVISLFEVDTVNEKFTVRINVTMMWQNHVHSEEEMDHLIKGLDDSNTEWEPSWYPRFGIRNKVESQEVDESFIAILASRRVRNLDSNIDQYMEARKSGAIKFDDFWLMRDYSQNAVVNMREDLQYFPFDLQLLLISLRMEHSSSQIALTDISEFPEEVRKHAPDHIRDRIPRTKATVNFDNVFTADRRCRTHGPCVVKLTNCFKNRAKRINCGSIEVGIFMTRAIGHYMYNLYLIVFFITTLFVANWQLKANDSNRLGCEFALLLTGQAFKVAVADKLPKVQYLTITDAYMFAGFLFMVMGFLFHVLASWRDSWHDDALDKRLGQVWFLLWQGFNVLFAVYGYVATSRHNEKLVRYYASNGYNIYQRDQLSVESQLKEDADRGLIHCVTEQVGGLLKSD